MKYSLSDIKKFYPDEKAKKEPIWGRIFVRRFSFYLTVPFINAGWSANNVSLLSCIVAFVGSALMCINNIYAIWAGAIVLNFWSVLDCVDGNIARCKREASLAGEFFDALGGYCICTFSLAGFGVAAYHTTCLIPERYSAYLILLGCLGSLCDILGRLIYQKFSNNVLRMERDRGENGNLETEHEQGKESKNDLSLLKRISMFIDYEFGTGGDELLFLLIAIAFHILDIFVILYSLYHIIGVLLVFILYVKKMKAYEKEHFEELYYRDEK